MFRLDRYDAFVFDLDGTLLDSNKAHADAFAAAMVEATGYRPTPEEMEEFNGNTTRAFSAELAQRHGLSLTPDNMMERKFELLYREFHARLFPGAREFLHAWCDRTRMALASNSPRHFIDHVLTREHLGGLFSAVVTIDDVTHRKPDPAIYHMALSRLGVEPSSALVFEDSVYGIEAGQRAGCDVVVLDNPGGAPPVQNAPGIRIFTWAELGEYRDVS